MSYFKKNVCMGFVWKLRNRIYGPFRTLWNVKIWVSNFFKNYLNYIESLAVFSSVTSGVNDIARVFDSNKTPNEIFWEIKIFFEKVY